MVAVLVGALLIALTGGGLVWLGRGMEAGQLNPNMGHMTARNTTPASWRKIKRRWAGHLSAAVGCGSLLRLRRSHTPRSVSPCSLLQPACSSCKSPWRQHFWNQLGNARLNTAGPGVAELVDGY